MIRSARRRNGFVLAEVIVAGMLLLLVVQVAWWTTAAQSLVATRIVTGARMLDETRLIHQVLSAEVRHGEAGGDWTIDAGDLALRAFRGIGFNCRTQPANGWGVAVAGYRSPDSDKDSVLVLDDGAWRPAALVRRTRNAGLDCQRLAGFSTEMWVLDPPPSRPVVALYFERGAYRLASDAFRYRRGLGGWQPLTGTGIEADSSILVAAGEQGLEIRLRWEDRSAMHPSFGWKVWTRR
ncbi:MAG: hypothetical protein F4139_11305 [Gemmatimonadetes bacterium]|nr:hypothetical protein [Gemmatimonadota bacterium]MYA63125.1 hypothetical protein [Gemmatimonadota bacterium]MYC00231.1 hypothetical protein [Gemmatimonadota bacterium]MYH53507.1 hypothetical protein [Gemmatimonadota bacterium]MYI45647.1 hypothetical protein [Gemmatimonadota bacterium]